MATSLYAPGISGSGTSEAPARLLLAPSMRLPPSAYGSDKPCFLYSQHSLNEANPAKRNPTILYKGN